MVNGKRFSLMTRGGGGGMGERLAGGHGHARGVAHTAVGRQPGRSGHGLRCQFDRKDQTHRAQGEVSSGGPCHGCSTGSLHTRAAASGGPAHEAARACAVRGAPGAVDEHRTSG